MSIPCFLFLLDMWFWCIRNDFDLEAFKYDFYNHMFIPEMLNKYDITRTTMYRIAKQHNFKRK